MPTILSADLQLAYRVADALAALEFPRFAAVFIGGVGTDWERAPAFPFAVVRVESAEQPRGGVTRTVRVRIVTRVDGADAPAKPLAIDAAGRVLLLTGFDEIANVVQPIRDALSRADLGAPLESIGTEYDAESQFPAQAADLALVFADAQAFGDAF